MAVSAGRILILPKGSYDSATTYEFLDAVYYQGSTYICKKTALNVLPSNTEYWQIMAQGTASASVAGNYYAECDTSASTPAKVISVPATEYFVLQVGDIVNVKFTYTNTATNPTLNINNTGNKPIVYDTSAVTTDNLWAGGEASRITSFMYDGTNWVWISHDVDTNTLSDLLDTTISSPTNKQGLIFNGTSNKWENGNIISTLAGLEDTTITNVANEQILKYNGTSNKWENAELVADDVNYDNTSSGLSATDVKEAIDEVCEKKTNISLVATIQTNLVASKSYSVGEEFVYNGLLYKVTATISSGGTITIDGNCSLSDNITKQIYDLNKQLQPSTLIFSNINNTYVTEILGKKYGIVNNLYIKLSNIPANTWVTIAKASSVPWMKEDFTVPNAVGGTGLAYIDTDGWLAIYSTAGGNFEFAITYLN